MKLGAAKYRELQAALDKIGITTCILRIGPNRYQFIQGYEVKKEYRLRRSCNARLLRLYRQNIQDNGNQ